MKQIIKNMVGALGVGLVRSKTLDQLLSTIDQQRSTIDQLWSEKEDVADLFDQMSRSPIFEGQSKAQLNQDIIVLLITNFKKDGFFVEFGATNGIDLSNTYLLEKSYEWKGILAEPAKIWHNDLSMNRNVNIDFSCVWRRSNDVVTFNMVDSAELSTIAEFSDRDHHAEARKNGETYDVKTISLNDLLEKYDAPQTIDYLSIDTEGSEFEILNNF